MLLRGNLKARAFAPVGPMRLRSSNSRCSESQTGKDSAMACMPRSPMRLLLRHSSLKAGAGGTDAESASPGLPVNNRATTAAPSSPRPQSSSRTACKRLAHGRMKAHAAAHPRLLSSCRFKFSSTELSRNWLRFTDTAVPLRRSGGSKVRVSTSVCAPEDSASMTNSPMAIDVERGSLRELKPSLVAPCTLVRFLRLSRTANAWIDASSARRQSS
mmetsp:Transcript_126788/g.253505  ORF Transcript_126788/g.253505 Transcript_126788/m.253505 type:complete len:215 (-) Transcript_126788:857-1501(-)